LDNTPVLITCKNCGNTFHGNFCNICGQKVIKGRFTIPVIFKDIAITIFNLEKGFFYTIKQLVLNPGKVLQGYLNGATKRYYNPFKLLIIVTGFLALFALATNSYDTHLGSLNEAISERVPDVNEEMQSPTQLRIQSLLKNNVNIIMLLFIPFYSIGYRIFYSRKSINYTEHLIINSYAFSIGNIISFPLSIITLFLKDYLLLEQVAGFVILILIYTYFYTSLLKNNFIKSFFKSLLAQILGFIFMLIVIMIITIILIIVFKTFSL
jgi:hypothetical protein